LLYIYIYIYTHTHTHGSVNRESNLIIVFQQDATYSVYCISVGSSTCFGCWHPSSGARTAVITDFDVLLTVNFIMFILVINQLDAQNLFYNKFLSCLYMFRAHVFFVRRFKLYYTASGIVKHVGGRPVHRLREVLSQPVHRTATYSVWRYQMLYNTISHPDDEHMFSKHVKAWKKLIVKPILYIKLVNY